MSPEIMVINSDAGRTGKEKSAVNMPHPKTPAPVALPLMVTIQGYESPGELVLVLCSLYPQPPD